MPYHQRGKSRIDTPRRVQSSRLLVNLPKCQHHTGTTFQTSPMIGPKVETPPKNERNLTVTSSTARSATSGAGRDEKAHTTGVAIALVSLALPDLI